LNLHHLQHFLAIADTGSVRAAAESLGLSQPAISKSLRVLETELGARLIERGARGSTLTTFGTLLYKRAKLIGNELERVTGEIRQLAGHGAGRVSLGSSATSAIVFLPQVVEAFQKRHPGAEIHVIGGLPSVLLPRLVDGSLDLVVGPRPAQIASPLIGTRTLMTTPSVIAARQGHRLAAARSLKAFVDARWVLNSSAGHAESSLHAAFAALGLPGPRIAVRADSFQAAYALIAKTDFVGLMPEYLLADRLIHNVLKFVEVPEFSASDSVELFYRNDLPLSALARSFADQLIAEATRTSTARGTTGRMPDRMKSSPRP
jgi:DNA-binding transcriptional LysR family regulator